MSNFWRDWNEDSLLQRPNKVWLLAINQHRAFSPDVDTRMDDDDALDVLEEALDELDSAVN